MRHLMGLLSPAFSAVEVRIEAHKIEIVLAGDDILIGIVIIELKLLYHGHEGLRVFRRKMDEGRYRPKA